MNKFTAAGLSVNPVLYGHLTDIFDEPKVLDIVSKKKSSIMEHIKCLVASYFLENQRVLIYNTSVLNLFLVLILKYRGSKIFFHLHDPIPHSGRLNLIVFLLNQILVFLSDEVLVFSDSLRRQTKKYYLASKIHVVEHGTTNFIYRPTFLKKINTISIGMLGRNMPYKGFEEFLSLVLKYPNIRFFCIGKGYPKHHITNLEYIDGFIQNDFYYSLFCDLDYVFFGHKKISYSGIVNDILALKKRIVSTPEAQKLLFNKDISICSIQDELTKQSTMDIPKRSGWDGYKRKLEIISLD